MINLSWGPASIEDCGRPLINCLCGAIADWASEGQILGRPFWLELALTNWLKPLIKWPLGAGLDKLAIGAGLN